VISSFLFSVMDAFVKIKTQKKNVGYTLHTKEINIIKEHINNGKNIMLCGAPGTGKTFIARYILDESNTIDITEDIKLVNNLINSNMHILLDDYRHDVLAQRQVVESISDGKPITKRSVLVCSDSICLLPNFELVIIPKRTPDTINMIAPIKNEHSMAMAIKCKGNLHNFLEYVNFSDEKDEFIEPKELASIVLCNKKIEKKMDVSSEHGHVWGVIHENYPDSSNVNANRIAHALSDADLFDTSIYRGEWHSMSFFSNSVIDTPIHYLGESLEASKLRPGSFWTKFGNYKMRSQKFENIKSRARCKGHEELYLLRLYAVHGNIDMYTGYNLTPQDFDVINHLSVGNKLKPREVSQVKKKIKEYQSKLT